MMDRNRKILRAFWTAAAAAGALALVLWMVSPSTRSGPGPGTPAPDFKMTDLGGRSVSLAELRGKVVLLDFWATWCDTCKVEIPALKSLHETFRDQPFVLLGASVDEGGPEVVARFTAAQELPYRVVFAGDAAVRDYRIFGLPTKFLIGPDGVVRKKYLMDSDVTHIERDIRELLAVQEKAS